MELTLENKKIMDEFGEDNLPSLSVCVLGALELFASEGLPEVKIPELRKPIIVGSGNAIVTASMLYADQRVVFADENNYRRVVETDHDGAVIFSASGEKHAALIAGHFVASGVKTTLVTCSRNSTAGGIVGEGNVIVTPKNREPYTYNTSTYMGWVLAKTRENPKVIWEFIQEEVAPKVNSRIGDYQGYFLVTPEMFARGNKLLEVKFTELFGRRVARDVKTYEEAKHAVAVVPYERELCIQFGEGEVDFANDRLVVPLFEGAGLAAMMAIGYWVVGKIQENKPQWFKENIGDYVARNAKKPLGKGLRVIVEK